MATEASPSGTSQKISPLVLRGATPRGPIPNGQSKSEASVPKNLRSYSPPERPLGRRLAIFSSTQDAKEIPSTTLERLRWRRQLLERA